MSAPEQIKLIIWDLDETFWQGTLAEDGRVSIPPANIGIIEELTARGIVNSICSKNDFAEAKSVLEEARVWDYFVFPHIAFSPKGEAVKQIISDMQLRAPNVLFIDDNHSNLEEVRYYNPEIQLLSAEEISTVLTLPGAAGKEDSGHTRLTQYKMLEERNKARESIPDNEAFLRASDIHISVEPSKPADAERIHDMIMRTNQLNFTKKRISLDEVRALLRDSAARSATVRVYDRFGDHGIIGWYCLRDGELIHFLFSCRTINLGIEQYIYAWLGYPRLQMVGDTASQVSAEAGMPGYITLDDIPKNGGVQEQTVSGEISERDKLQIYALGACDLFNMVGHMALPLTKVQFECNTFNGDTRGVNVATEYIRSCFEMGDQEKAFCRAHFHNYTGSTAFGTEIFAREYDFVCLSFHDDFALETYQSKKYPNMRVVLSNSRSGTFTPILNPGGIKTFDARKWLNREFTPLGLISPERFRENLDWIARRLPAETKLILMTGPEYDYFRDAEPHNPAFREQVVRLNAVIRAFCAENPRAALVEMNEIIFERGHFTNFIMHLKPERSYLLALQMLKAMANAPRVKGLKSALPIGGRQTALWTEDSFPLPHYYALCACGAKPDRVVTANKAGIFEGLEVSDAVALFEKSAEYYVLVTPGKHLDYTKTALDFYGYRPDLDYHILSPTPFTLDWKEN